jgi:hypothetical protein
MSCILEMVEEKWEYSETVYQLFVNFSKVCDRLKIFYDIIIELECL